MKNTFVKTLKELKEKAKQNFKKNDVLTGHELKEATEENMERINELEERISKLEEKK